MRKRGIVLVVAALVGPSVALAENATVGTPDRRVEVHVEEQRTDDGGRVAAEGHVGAYHLDHSVEGDASEQRLRITNPPMFRAVGSDGNEMEELYGPPVARAALGTGGLTVAFRGDGVLTNLNWPGPGFYDHVNYLHRTRGVPNGGAPENAGSFAGLLLPDGATWMTEMEGWRVARQAYESDQSGVLRTDLVHDDLGVKVRIRDVVHPTMDVLARRIEVVGKAPAGARLAYFANMNPTTSRVPRAPSVTDAVADEASDFATVYDEASDGMLHLRPYRLDPAAATVAVTGRLGDEENLAAAADTSGPGVYVAVAGDGAPAEYQAGLEAAGLVREEAEATPLLDPYYDARDGTLSGSAAAVGKTAGAQAWDGASGTVYVVAGESAGEVRDAVAEARTLGFDGIRRASDVDWREWLRGVRLPMVDDERTEAVAKRALMLVRTAQDRRTGAITANVTTQTPYRQDWLRDGAFFNYALLLAGTEETVAMVRRHNDFYRRAQSETGHWDPILCTDGAHCDAAFPFEIDAQAFGVWTLWTEYEFTGDAGRLALNYEAIRKGAEVLMACEDPTTGLQCYASEDDHVQPTQGPQGAATVYLGLRSAAAAARLVDPGSGDAGDWDARATELRAAARDAFCDRTCRTGRGYMVWPGGVLTAGDGLPEHADLQRTLDQVGRVMDRQVARELPPPDGFFQYPMEPMFGLAVAWDDEAAGERLGSGVRWLTHEVAEPGVDHYAERIFHLDTDGDGRGDRYLHSVGFPHVWSGAETYIAAALVHGLPGCASAAAGSTCRA